MDQRLTQLAETLNAEAEQEDEEEEEEDQPQQKGAAKRGGKAARGR